VGRPSPCLRRLRASNKSRHFSLLPSDTNEVTTRSGGRRQEDVFIVLAAVLSTVHVTCRITDQTMVPDDHLISVTQSYW